MIATELDHIYRVLLPAQCHQSSRRCCTRPRLTRLIAVPRRLRRIDILSNQSELLHLMSTRCLSQGAGTGGTSSPMTSACNSRYYRTSLGTFSSPISGLFCPAFHVQNSLDTHILNVGSQDQDCLCAPRIVQRQMLGHK